MRKCGSSIDEGLCRKRPSARQHRPWLSASDTSIARRAKATASTQGNALPQRFSSSATIHRLGSSMAKPCREALTATSIDRRWNSLRT